MEALSDDRALLSIPDTCRVISLGRSTVYELINNGDLKTVKVGSRRLVIRRSIDDLVDRLASGGAEAA